MSAALALQKGINTTLRDTAPLQALVGARVLDRVKAGETLPYVHLRQFQEIDDSTSCGDAWEVYGDVDVWSDVPGKVQASQIASLIRDALHEQDIPLDEPYALIELRHRDTQIGDGGDGLLTRARISFRALIERV